MCSVHLSNETDANVILGSVIVPVEHSSGTEIITKKLLKASKSDSRHILLRSAWIPSDICIVHQKYSKASLDEVMKQETKMHQQKPNSVKIDITTDIDIEASWIEYLLQVRRVYALFM